MITNLNKKTTPPFLNLSNDSQNLRNLERAGPEDSTTTSSFSFPWESKFFKIFCK